MRTPSMLNTAPTWLINQASLHATRIVNDRIGAMGAHRYQYRLLAALAEYGDSSQADLSRGTMVDRSDVVAALKDLEADGYVRRSPDPADNRRNVVTLTPTGRRRLREMEKSVAACQDELLAPHTEHERERLVALLSRVVEHHAAAHEG
jgi:DNA-binding MarR family transcriptional regulator